MKSKFEFLPSYNSYIDYIYGWLLRLFSKKEILSEEQFKTIKETAAYFHLSEKYIRKNKNSFAIVGTRKITECNFIWKCNKRRLT